jgi:hypothetical protein
MAVRTHGTKPENFPRVLEKYRAKFRADEISSGMQLDGSWEVSVSRDAWFRVMDGDPEFGKAMLWLHEFHGHTQFCRCPR